MSLLAERYARVACANLAAGSAQTLAADLRRCAALIEAHPDLREALHNPRLRADIGPLMHTLLGRLELSPLAMRLIEALLHNGRAALLPAVVQAIGALATRRAGELWARVQSAVALSSEQQTALAAALHRRLGQAILLQVEVDPDLLGGLRCEVGDFVFDSTLRGHLARLRDQVARRGVGRA